jgi:hypothetical protein
VSDLTPDEEIRFAAMAVLGAALPGRDFLKQHESRLWAEIERLAYHCGFDFREPSAFVSHPKPPIADPADVYELRGIIIDRVRNAVYEAMPLIAANRPADAIAVLRKAL